MDKQRVNVWISARNYRALEMLTCKPGVSKTDIVDTAMTHYLYPDERSDIENAILPRLDEIDLQQGNLERDLAVTTEALGQFILYWLTLTEPLRAGEREDAQKLGQKRLDHFLDQVGRKIGTQTTFSIRLWERLLPPDEDTKQVAAE